MKIMITGNMGYIGPIVVQHLKEKFPRAQIIGVDTGLFGHCLTAGCLPERQIDSQVFLDVRSMNEEMLDGVDAIVHLAAVSNDPMGLRYEAVTEEVNQNATIRLAELAARSGVKRFVFASSCSVYGFADTGTCSEDDAVNPLTAYARSKAGAEIGLKRVANASDLVVTALRFATACGFSSRTRLDLVLNDFVASALSTRHISVLSDGTPWRPLIHVCDMARAIEWAIIRPLISQENFLTVNVGREDWNYRVADLADAVSSLIPGTLVNINKNAQPDKRSYRVDFSRYKAMAPDHQPVVSLEDAVADLRDGLIASGFKDPDYRHSSLIRFHVLEQLIKTGQLQPDLRWSQMSSVMRESRDALEQVPAA
jgi:nucleoside-diphosphate-sugar epimerase